METQDAPMYGSVLKLPLLIMFGNIMGYSHDRERIEILQTARVQLLHEMLPRTGVY